MKQEQEVYFPPVQGFLFRFILVPDEWNAEPQDKSLREPAPTLHEQQLLHLE